MKLEVQMEVLSTRWWHIGYPIYYLAIERLTCLQILSANLSCASFLIKGKLSDLPNKRSLENNHTGMDTQRSLIFSIGNIYMYRTAELGTVDRATIQFWNLMAKGQSAKASNFHFISILKILEHATNQDVFLLAWQYSMWIVKVGAPT